MRHLRSGRKLNRTASHRKAMFSNLAVSLFDKERIVTTKVKAKEMRPFVERLITYGKKGTLHAIRIAGRTVRDKNILHKLFHDIAPGYKAREGGYTRILTLKERDGDNAVMALIELVGRSEDVQRTRKRAKKSRLTASHAGGKKEESAVAGGQESQTPTQSDNPASAEGKAST